MLLKPRPYWLLFFFVFLVLLVPLGSVPSFALRSLSPFWVLWQCFFLSNLSAPSSPFPTLPTNSFPHTLPLLCTTHCSISYPYFPICFLFPHTSPCLHSSLHSQLNASYCIIKKQWELIKKQSDGLVLRIGFIVCQSISFLVKEFKTIPKSIKTFQVLTLFETGCHVYFIYMSYTVF